MKKTVVILTIVSFQLLVFSFYVNAQNEIEALRYSTLFTNGTARYLGIGGAFGAVGADFSTLSSNPAGIALYKSSEFTITPSFFNGNTSSDYLMSTNSDNKYDFALGNVGFIFTGKAKNSTDDSHGFKNFQFGFGLNRTADFNNRILIQGYNSKSSLMTEYTNAANAEHTTPGNLHEFDTYLAYRTYLIDPIPPDSMTYTSPLYNGKMLQKFSSTYSGSSNEAVISGGANYDDRLYIGATLGIPYFNYTEKSNYSENDIYNMIPNITDFNLHKHLEDNGTGINVKFGLIYRITDWLRVGAAIHSPSFYKVNRVETRNMTSDAYGSSIEYDSPRADFNYNFQTPAHYLGSAAFIIGKYGLVDVDYEYVDYSTMKFHDPSNEFDYSMENQNISNIYTGQHNIRVGGELKLEPFVVRQGLTIPQALLFIRIMMKASQFQQV